MQSLTRIKEWTAQLDSLLPAAMVPASELVRALRRDHDDLRTLLEILKSDKPIQTRRTAYKRFSMLLKSHARAEEKAVYDVSQRVLALRKKTLEGFVEHEVADALVARIRAIRQPEKWTAAVQVLAELVEHHLDEEERDLLPLLDRTLSLETRLAAEARFLEERDASPAHGVLTGVAQELH